MRPSELLVGDKISEWTVLNTDNCPKIMCRCSCGTEREVNGYDLINFRSTNCGHLNRRNDTDVNVGDKIFEYTVTDILSPRYIMCRCSCGVEKRVNKYHLINGRTKSCGHLKMQALAKNSKDKFYDLANQQLGEWKVLEYIENSIWKCECSCGRVAKVSSYALRTGKSTSCGHNSNEFKDLTGKKFGEWTVLNYCENRLWKCRCSCGEEKKVPTNHLISRYSKSCGHDGHKFIDLTNSIKGDLHVDSYIGNLKWKCTCVKCGEEKEVYSYALRNEMYEYKCKNTHHIGERINKLEIIGQLSGTTVVAKCDICGSIKAYKYSNILKNTSCGCMKPKSYNRDECIEAINKFISEHKEKPFTEDLMQILDISRRTAYKYRNEYELDNYFNTSYGSKYERDIAEFLNKLSIEYKLHVRNVINPLELDIYIPDKKLAIEINGDYWHSESYIDKDYHINKTKRCNEVGVQLIHLFEHELRDGRKKNIIYNMIKSMVKAEHVVYARELKIEETDTEDTKRFMINNHINGYAASAINIALKSHDNEIIAMMTFGIPRFDREKQYELIRLCYKNDYLIVGGAEKMFKYFITKYNADSIISYCDMSKFSGGVYTKLGFTYESYTVPNYRWVRYKDNEVLSRYKTQKYRLISAGLGTENQTEDEIMSSLGYLKIFDCGNKKFKWER